MGRILVFLIGFAVLAYIAFVYINKNAGADDATGVQGPSAAKQTLDRTREAARQIEVDAQRRVDETLRKTE